MINRVAWIRGDELSANSNRSCMKGIRRILARVGAVGPFLILMIAVSVAGYAETPDRDMVAILGSTVPANGIR